VFVDGSPEADWYEVLNIDIDEIHCCNNMTARDSSQKPFPTAAMLSIHIHCILISNHMYNTRNTPNTNRVTCTMLR